KPQNTANTEYKKTTRHVRNAHYTQMNGWLFVIDLFRPSLVDEAERMAGRVPRNETEIIKCERCGPVWAPPEVAAALPVVKGIPRALGCPWCHVRKAGKAIPRPLTSFG
ncbi:MAG: hypothetical protein PF483_01050, partial [Halothiobacillus sp.]|nr:hypothetical protein [Halothiobacillus sp.]